MLNKAEYYNYSRSLIPIATITCRCRRTRLKRPPPVPSAGVELYTTKQEKTDSLSDTNDNQSVTSSPCYDAFATIISVYAPTMTNPEENKEAFYNQLASVLSGISRTDKLLLIGDFNARIGRDNDKWPLVMGKHGIGKCNSNGSVL
ncbi:hypothetical protein NP493_64g04018 [Ridgeia piscesae]|uniref:Craniofacial development protein 2-like n=1 Tax=Ridgeia piscesae TaxID=27915 RepID=A0AAD9PA49_RIDPI|nr:hypothetical protein NP493_64g04018 [Ridgeia piscesae]